MTPTDTKSKNEHNESETSDMRIFRQCRKWRKRNNGENNIQKARGGDLATAGKVMGEGEGLPGKLKKIG